MYGKSIIIFGITLILSGCESFDSRLKIVNKTSFPIYYDFYFNKNDSLTNNFDVYIRSSIQVNDTSRETTSGIWLRELQQSDTKRLSLYFYNIDSLKINRYKYQNMRQYFLAKKHFTVLKLSEKQLDSCNWIVTVKE